MVPRGQKLEAQSRKAKAPVRGGWIWLIMQGSGPFLLAAAAHSAGPLPSICPQLLDLSLCSHSSTTWPHSPPCMHAPEHMQVLEPPAAKTLCASTHGRQLSC